MKPSSDLMILAALRDRDHFRILNPSVPKDSLGTDCQWLLRWFPTYFAAYPEHQELDPQALLALVQLRGKLDDDQAAIAKALCSKLEIPVSADVVAGVVQQLSERAFAGEAARLIMQYQAGEDVDILHELGKLSSTTAEAVAKSAPIEYVADEDIFSILEEEETGHGLSLSFLRGFQDGIKPLLPGDTVLVAGCVDGGKTSLLAKIATCFAPQIQTLYGDRPVLWGVNEGSCRRILPRAYQAALNCTTEDLYTLSNAGTLLDKYREAMHGGSRLRLKDIHGWNMGKVEQWVQANNPACVILDMVANIRTGKEQKGHEKVEALWQEFREMAVRHNFVAVGTSQISGEGYGIPYPPMTALKDSKVGTQGATDVIIMMGDQRDKPDLANRRWMSAPKNKRKPTGVPMVRFETYFNPDTCQFTDGG